MRVLAVYHVALGRSIQDAASIACAHRASVGAWVSRFLERGVAGLGIEPGRGRPQQVRREELERYLLRSPREFGLDQTRWTLAGLIEAVPCLKGMSVSGVRKALVRIGYGYKRGQPHLHSPDPEYEQKRGSWQRR